MKINLLIDALLYAIYYDLNLNKQAYISRMQLHIPIILKLIYLKLKLENYKELVGEHKIIIKCKE